MKIDKSDIEILDFIVDRLLESEIEINSNVLNKLEQFKQEKNSDLSLEFQRLLSIIEYYNCARINKFGYGSTANKNGHTKKFKDQGGFEKIYQDELTRLEKEEERESLSIKKLKWDAKLSKWQVKTFWWVFIFGFFGFIFGLYNFIDNLNKTESIETLKQDNQYIQEEVSRLRTLVLDQKPVDPLHNPKTQFDDLRMK